MNREQFIKNMISSKGYNIKSFAQYIGMPYSTLLTILNGSLGGAAFDNVIKICQGLGISINELQEHDVSADVDHTLSAHEKALIIAYRKKPDMQPAVDRLLGISDDPDTVRCVASLRKSISRHTQKEQHLKRCTLPLKIRATPTPPRNFGARS